MQTKHLCVFIHIWTKGEVGTLKPVSSPSVKYFTDRSKAVLLLWIICIFWVLCFSSFRICSLLPCGHLLGKGWPFGSCWWCLLFCLFCCFTSQVNSYGHCGTVSSHNHTFFLGKLEQAVNQYFMHILSLVTNNNPSWMIQRKGGEWL